MAKTPVKEENETPADEAADSPEMQAKGSVEDAKTDDVPAEESSEASSVKIPEAFQQEVDGVVAQCTTPAQLDYIISCVDDKRSNMFASESRPTPDFSEDDMPKD